MPSSRRETQLFGALPLDGSTVPNIAVRERFGWSKETYFSIRKSLLESNKVVRKPGRGGTIGRNIQALTDHFMAAIPADGERISKSDHLKVLQWDDPFYESIKRELIATHQIRRVHGPGFAIARGVAESPCEPKEPQEEDRDYPNEHSLYDSIFEVIRDTWVREQNFDRSLVEVTATGGAKSTGSWSRPDITVVAKRSYRFVPRRELEVITFEVKHYATNKSNLVTGVYEALAHRISATQSYLLVYLPGRVVKEMETTISEIVSAARELGIGLIVVDNPREFDSWDIRLDANVEEPDPTKLDEYIANRISEKGKDDIRRWFS